MTTVNSDKGVKLTAYPSQAAGVGFGKATDGAARPFAATELGDDALKTAMSRDDALTAATRSDDSLLSGAPGDDALASDDALRGDDSLR